MNLKKILLGVAVVALSLSFVSKSCGQASPYYYQPTVVGQQNTTNLTVYAWTNAIVSGVTYTNPLRIAMVNVKAVTIEADLQALENPSFASNVTITVWQNISGNMPPLTNSGPNGVCGYTGSSGQLNQFMSPLTNWVIPAVTQNLQPYSLNLVSSQFGAPNYLYVGTVLPQAGVTYHLTNSVIRVSQSY